MNGENPETVEYLKARLEELLDLADRLDLSDVGAWVASAIEQIPEGDGG